MSPRNLCSENFVTPLLLQSETEPPYEHQNRDSDWGLCTLPKCTLSYGLNSPPLTVVLRTSVPEQVIALSTQIGQRPRDLSSLDPFWSLP